MEAKAAVAAAPAHDTATQPAPGPLTIRKGRSYLRRDGKVVGPAEASALHAYPWVVGEFSYKSSGHFLKSGDREVGSLIAECDAFGWVTWTGGERPVPAKCVVEYELRDGRGFQALAEQLEWLNISHPNDIVRFRVVQS